MFVLTNYYNEIKKELLNYEITKKVKEYSINKSEFETKYNVGKMLIEAQGGEERAKYGNGLIKEYSIKLLKETGLKYSETSLKYMRQFYLFKKSHAVHDQFNLSWNHYKKLFTLKDNGQIKYYIDICEKYHLSYRQLGEKIKSKEYERLSEETKNKLSLDSTQEYQIADFIKNPIIMKNTKKDENVSEKVLQKLILEDIPSFLKELGEGFTFIENEYKIKLGNRYNYIDLLLFNIKYNSYVVIELKTTELKKEHIGQVQVYMNYIDENIKTIYQDKTIGIIIAKEDNKYVMKYCSDKRIFNTRYVLN
ncbi:MAG: DUF1016 domain-containing protein [Firmicutes bacterium]|nr:DUF1016 domain-containing protein [Bacillota bacterium]